MVLFFCLYRDLCFKVSFTSMPSLTCDYKSLIGANSKSYANTDLYTSNFLPVYCWANPLERIWRCKVCEKVGAR